MKIREDAIKDLNDKLVIKEKSIETTTQKVYSYKKVTMNGSVALGDLSKFNNLVKEASTIGNKYIKIAQKKLKDAYENKKSNLVQHAKEEIIHMKLLREKNIKFAKKNLKVEKKKLEKKVKLLVTKNKKDIKKMAKRIQKARKTMKVYNKKMNKAILKKATKKEKFKLKLKILTAKDILVRGKQAIKIKNIEINANLPTTTQKVIKNSHKDIHIQIHKKIAEHYKTKHSDLSKKILMAKAKINHAKKQIKMVKASGKSKDEITKLVGSWSMTITKTTISVTTCTEKSNKILGLHRKHQMKISGILSKKINHSKKDHKKLERHIKDITIKCKEEHNNSAEKIKKLRENLMKPNLDMKTLAKVKINLRNATKDHKTIRKNMKISCKAQKKAIKTKIVDNLINPKLKKSALNMAVKTLNPDASIEIVKQVNMNIQVDIKSYSTEITSITEEVTNLEPKIFSQNVVIEKTTTIVQDLEIQKADALRINDSIKINFLNESLMEKKLALIDAKKFFTKIETKNKSHRMKIMHLKFKKSNKLKKIATNHNHLITASKKLKKTGEKTVKKAKKHIKSMKNKYKSLQKKLEVAKAKNDVSYITSLTTIITSVSFSMSTMSQTIFSSTKSIKTANRNVKSETMSQSKMMSSVTNENLRLTTESKEISSWSSSTSISESSSFSMSSSFSSTTTSSSSSSSSSYFRDLQEQKLSSIKKNCEKSRVKIISKTQRDQIAMILGHSIGEKNILLHVRDNN